MHLALFEHAEVEPRAAVRDEQRGDARVVHAEPDAVAGHARLGDLEDGGADPVPVADAHLVVAQPIDREVLAELSVDEVASSELTFPVPVRVDLVDEHRALLAAVPTEVALAVAVEVELAHAAGPVTGSLKTPVNTVLPCQGTSFGRPTLTDTRTPAELAPDACEAMPCPSRMRETMAHRPGKVERSFRVGAPARRR